MIFFFNFVKYIKRFKKEQLGIHIISIIAERYMYIFKCIKQVMEKGTWDRVWLKKSLRRTFIHLWVLFTGLCGNARLADVGGPGFLLPLPQKDKVSIQY